MDNHGLDQAKAQAKSIVALIASINCDYDRLGELQDEIAERASAILDAETPDEVKNQNQRINEWKAENQEELDALKLEAGEFADGDEARENLQNDPLSVEVRSGWDVVGGDLSAAEFRIVLCTGGPHVEIRGELNDGAPSRAWMMYQDWGTPLTQYFDVEGSTLLAYCQEFYFGG